MSKKVTQLDKNLAMLKRLVALPRPEPEKPSPYLMESLAASRKDIEEGRVSPGFSNADDAISWLNKKKPRYVGRVQQ